MIEVNIYLITILHTNLDLTIWSGPALLKIKNIDFNRGRKCFKIVETKDILQIMQIFTASGCKTTGFSPIKIRNKMI